MAEVESEKTVARKIVQRQLKQLNKLVNEGVCCTDDIETEKLIVKQMVLRQLRQLDKLEKEHDALCLKAEKKLSKPKRKS